MMNVAAHATRMPSPTLVARLELPRARATPDELAAKLQDKTARAAFLAAAHKASIAARATRSVEKAVEGVARRRRLAYAQQVRTLVSSFAASSRAASSAASSLASLIL